MQLKRIGVGAHGRKQRYFIDNGGATLCYFDDLLTAAIVLRFLRGNVLSREEIIIACEAMRAFDERFNEAAQAAECAKTGDNRRQKSVLEGEREI